MGNIDDSMGNLDTSLARTEAKTQAKRRQKKLEFIGEGNVLTAYLKEIKQYETLTLKQEQELAFRVRAGDGRAVNDLVQANLKFVWAVCLHYRFKGLPMCDLVSEGNLGLIRAARLYDGSRGFKFISYAVWWIRQGILTALAEQTRVLTLPASRVQVIYKVNRLRNKMEQQFGRSPDDQELAEASGHDVLKIVEFQQLTSPSLSLSRPFLDSDGSLMEDSLKDENGERPDQSSRQFLLGKNTMLMLGVLDKRERNVIELYYGIGCETSFDLVEIGGRLGISRERVRQIRNLALKRLRHPAFRHRVYGLKRQVEEKFAYSPNVSNP